MNIAAPRVLTGHAGPDGRERDIARGLEPLEEHATPGYSRRHRYPPFPSFLGINMCQHVQQPNHMLLGVPDGRVRADPAGEMHHPTQVSPAT